ncbi:MAG: glycosyl transferase family 2 [Bacteroidetes bacterium HGW-Bacteroidetes-11]|jgi:cellulose synthase/poly-beta-1,6-N-acetylglucosamine synthase-like glycosyltransferase|nr:MAG: glycosyl transferase family 2 [Bacteroidetes bacterium HGW-Bacteroidetes-11]
MNPAFQTFYLVIQLVFFTLLVLATLYILLFGFAGLFYRQPAYKSHSFFRKIAVLIPGYKEDDVIIEVAREALTQDYPVDRYDIVIIADSFQPETIAHLREMPIKVIEVKFDKSTKSKALNKAMEQLPYGYDITVVLDADNLMATDFLKKINAAFEMNFAAVQGHRTAKNMNTSLAILDSISEEINNHIFRKGHRVLGLSSAIIGSGMAFRYDFFKDMMASVTAVGGFDKEIELHMLRNNYKIAYLDDAYVYDEKVQKAEVFSNQRRRWLSAQLHYFRKDILSSAKALVTSGNIDYFDKAIQFIQPPRILLLGAVFSVGLLFFLLNILLGISHLYNIGWIILVAACILAFLFSIPTSFYNLRTLKAMASLPKGMVLMLGSLLKIKGANKQFIHTKHTAVKPKKPSN